MQQECLIEFSKTVQRVVAVAFETETSYDGLYVPYNAGTVSEDAGH